MGMLEDDMAKFRKKAGDVGFGKSWIRDLDFHESQKNMAERKMRNSIVLMLAIILAATLTEIFVLTSETLDLVEEFFAPLIALATVTSLLTSVDELKINYREACNAIYSMIKLYKDFNFVLEQKEDEEI